MEKTFSAAATTASKVYGNVRDKYQQPLANVTIGAFDKDIRSEQQLGRVQTDAKGYYEISYTPENFSYTDKNAADVFVRLYDANAAILYESPVTFNAKAQLNIDIDLSGQAFRGSSEFEQMQAGIIPYTGQLDLSALSENEKVKDISFLINKTGLPQDKIEDFAMAYRFFSLTKVEAAIFYGLLREGLPGNTLSNTLSHLTNDVYEPQLSFILDGLMHENIAVLLNGIKKAVSDNIIAYRFLANLDGLKKQLTAAIQEYNRSHPVTGDPGAIFAKLQIAGLSKEDSDEFMTSYSAHLGTIDQLFTNLQTHPNLARHNDKLNAVFQLSELTGGNMTLTTHLIKSGMITQPDDLKKLARYNSEDWEAILSKKEIASGLSATKLEANFTRKFPTAAFTARLEKDNNSSISHAATIAGFLNAHPNFDLLHTRIHQFAKTHPASFSSKNITSDKKTASQTNLDATTFADHLKRVQRVFKLAPTYTATAALLEDNIHSASQIYQIGKDNFIRQYAGKLDTKTADDIFQKATQVHSQSLAFATNIKSLSDASLLKVFPDYKKLYSSLTAEIPDLVTLFGNGDYCECDECNSVGGAASYLTDILHYLAKRNSNTIGVSAKDWLLLRRPDIGDIDLNCANTNTETPYIDIACELMEDYINPPVISLAIPPLKKGVIDNSTYTSISGGFKAAGFENVSNLLTTDAMVSDMYSSIRFDGTNKMTETHWIIRDKLVVLKATPAGANVNIQLLHQTLLSRDEISANPEYINLPVYQDNIANGTKGILNNATRPFALPFDLFETEGELYLIKLGINKYDLIKTFNKEHDISGPPSNGDLQVAYAYLGINEAESALIFQPDTTHQTTYWGPMAAGTSAGIKDFEKASGLAYTDILLLLSQPFINPGQKIVIEHKDLSCDTSTKHIIHLSPDAFDRIHRFLRLWKKTSLSMPDLDAIIRSVVGNGNIDTPFAVALHHFLQLQQAWSLSTAQLLTFYQDIDTAGDNSLYIQLFQNRSITNPVNPDFSIAAVTAGTTAITTLHEAVITAATGLLPEDLHLLISRTDGKLSLKNLSYFYRVYLLSQSLSVPVASELDGFDLINIDPFSSPVFTSLFKEKFTGVANAGFTIDELNYVLRHQDTADNTYIASTKQISASLAALQSSLLQVAATTTVSPDPQGALLTKWLSDPLLNWDPGMVNKLLDILNTADDVEYAQKIVNAANFLNNLRVQYNTTTIIATLPTLPVFSAGDQTIWDSYTAQVSYDNAAKQLVWHGYMSAADQAALTGLLSGTPEFKNAVNNVFGQSLLTDNTPPNIFIHTPADLATLTAITWADVANRFAYFLQIISPVYNSIRQQQTIAAQLTTWFSVAKQLTAQLMLSISNIFTVYTNNAFINKQQDLTPTNYPAQFNLYLQLQKICFLAVKLKLSVTDLQWQLAHAAAAGSLDYLLLPLVAVPGAVTTFVQFEALVCILKFAQRHPQKTLDATVTPSLTLSVYDILLDAISAKSIAAIEADLVTLTGWNQDDLKKLVETPDYLNLAAPVDFTSPLILSRLDKCFSVLSTLNIGADDAIAWSKPSLTYDDAVKIVQTLKSNYADEDWLPVSQPLQDQLREKKRDALIAYLLANPGTQHWATDAELYSYFLLDVEMCACQPTSRIVQATNSVQLFVQRCFLALEPAVTVDVAVDSDWSQWEWMKFYRLSQANYKVFLYPENWIEPELLPVKSSFFKDLETNLSQNEVTGPNVEDAFMTYLHGLDSVARLEVKGMWYDDAGKTLYVVARTYGGDPKIYYFRKLSIVERLWTPWEKIDLDINSDHIVPVMYNNRFYLFWAVFTEKSDPPVSLDIPEPKQSGFPLQPADKDWLIQMGYSEYRQGKWMPKKISAYDDSGMLTVQQNSGVTLYHPYKSSFLFTPLDMPQIDLVALVKQYEAGNKKQDLAQFLLQAIEKALSKNGDLIINCYYTESDQSGNPYYNYKGSFKLDPCRGYPERVHAPVGIHPWLFDNSALQNMLDGEQSNHVLSLSSVPILNNTPTAFRNVIPFQMGFLDRYIAVLYELLGTSGLKFASNERVIKVSLGTFMSYFYQDGSRTYYVRPELTDNGNFEFLYSDFEDLFFAIIEQNTARINEIMSTVPKNSQFFLMHHYFNFYHPLACYFMRVLFTKGVDGLMSRDTQLKGDVAYDSNPDKFNFKDFYNPSALVYNDALNPASYPNALPNPVTDLTPGYPREDVDFNPEAGYSLYNWELFFHAPLMIAERLDQNQQFEDADKWYKYIFNPTDTSAFASPDKFWVTKPFFINVNDKYNKQLIDNILLGVNAGDQDLVKDVTAWRNNPFQPHLIASYRTVAYQKTAVMKYIDHLIAWGDNLFTQDTMESVNEATQLYLLAAQILGPRPETIPPAYERPVDNYYQLEQKLDALSNAMVDIENLMPLQTIIGYDGVKPQPKMPTLQTLYFCLPANDQLLGYWDTVAQRLYNIRHCLNIEGVFSPLSLFAPPINPGLLVRAAAQGLDLGSILNDLNSPLPFYRFQVMIQKATELTVEVKSLGASLLVALEKKDAETLSLLRSGQEISVLKAVMNVKNKQITDAQIALDNLNKQKELITIRQQYYQNLIKSGLNTGESVAIGLNTASTVIDAAIAIGYALSGGLKLVPDFMIGAAGFGGSPTVTAQTGGTSFGDSAEDAVKTLSSIATALDKGAAIASTLAGYARRSDEWQYQVNLATKEQEQIDKQILGAQIKLDIANTEVTNQQLQIDNAQVSNELMHSKFTNEDLYNWMITQISTVYFQGYNLAYATAKKAEQCLRYELALTDSAYIRFAYWDSLKKGLLSGEQLMNDLHRLELAYYELNKREYELTKHISLAQLDAAALLKLKTTGDCWINLPEELFDLDYPGQFMRRIKSVSLTIPCVTGPYTTISCTLTLNKNSLRINANASGSYPRKMATGVPADDPRFRDAVGAIQSIATSSGQNDNGLFELNFKDERYLPFEGAGAISLWRLQLPAALRQFDYDTISDVIIHLRYTAREGGDGLKQAAITNITNAINVMLVSQKDKGLMRLFDFRHEFPTEWYKFLHPANPTDQQVLTINISPDRFPYFAQGNKVKITSIEWIAETQDPVDHIELKLLAASFSPIKLAQDNVFGAWMHGTVSSVNKTLPLTATPLTLNYPMTSNLPNSSPLTEDNCKNLLAIVHYQLT